MAYLNLRVELYKNQITLEEVASLLGIHRNTVSNKINGDSSFSIEEATTLRNAYFKGMPIEYLFAKSGNDKSAC